MKRNMESIGVPAGHIYIGGKGGRKMKQVLGISCMALLLLFPVSGILFAQDLAAQDVAAQGQDQNGSSQAQAQQPAQQFSPDQLNAMVAPIALYPDNLLSQVLAASTYPLEVVEAAQWLRQNGNLQGQQLVDAARQQNWDPSVQALVVFPDVLNRLNSDIRWTTDLGNAFLAQQADVMSAVQNMRAQARAAGKLNSNAQETVTTQTQGDQTAINIQPADPQVVYVPSYNPEYIWGPPAYGYYPPLYYPAGFGFGFGPGIYIGGFFGGLGWGGWGWGCNWFGGSIFVNGFFFNHYGFGGFGGGRFGGRAAWAFNPAHRMGVAYPNQRLASRFGGNFAARDANRGSFANRGSSGSRFQTSQGPSAARSSQANGFRSSAAQPSYRTSPGGSSAYRSAPASGGSSAYRSAPSYGGSSAYRSAPSSGGSSAYRSAPSYGGNSAYRSAPSSSGTYSGAHTTPAYRSAPSSGGGYRSAPSASGGSSFHGGGGGGGGFHGGGGGGGSHGGGRR
jgi:hypothetical protein